MIAIIVNIVCFVGLMAQMVFFANNLVSALILLTGCIAISISLPLVIILHIRFKKEMKIMDKRIAELNNGIRSLAR